MDWSRIIDIYFEDLISNSFNYYQIKEIFLLMKKIIVKNWSKIIDINFEDLISNSFYN